MDDNVATIYSDGTYAEQNQALGDDNAAWKAGNIMAMLRLRNLQPKSILEVGCGGGGILVELQKQLGADVTFMGYEPMPEAFEKASGRSNERLHFKKTTVGDAPEAVFDLVLCLDVFEHVEDYFKFLRELRRHGKQFIFHIPLDMNTQMVARETPIKRVRQEVGHIHYFSKYTALATLEYCGYKIDHWFFTKSWTSAYRSLFARLATIPRRFFFSFAPEWTARLLGGLPLLVLAESEGKE